MNIADLRSAFQWIVDHWKTWGVPGLVIGGAKVIQVTLRHLYAWVLLRRDETREQIAEEVRHMMRITNVTVSEERVNERLRIPKWLIARAIRWKKRQKILGSS
jgi:hypothetical protein